MIFSKASTQILQFQNMFVIPQLYATVQVYNITTK